MARPLKTDVLDRCDTKSLLPSCLRLRSLWFAWTLFCLAIDTLNKHHSKDGAQGVSEVMQLLANMKAISSTHAEQEISCTSYSSLPMTTLNASLLSLMPCSSALSFVMVAIRLGS